MNLLKMQRKRLRMKKKCTKCNITKSHDQFHKDKNGLHGVYYCCKKCKNFEQRIRKANTNNPVLISEKKCSKCTELKKSEDFHKDRSNPDGLQYLCIECNYFLHIEKKYNLPKCDYLNLLHKQEHKCAICTSTDFKNKSINRFHVDHNHSTGKVRGLLCDNCNRALGFFKDNENNLKRALEYLNEDI